MKEKQTLHDKQLQAEQRGCDYLAKARAAEEKGDIENAAIYYAYAEKWLVRLNKLEDKTL